MAPGSIISAEVPKAALAVVILCAFCAYAQETAPKPAAPAPAKPKAKKVYTEEDLGNLRGSISVVGDSIPKPKVEESTPAASMDDLDEPLLPEEKSDRPPAADKKPKTPSNCRSAAWAKIVDMVARQQGLTMAEGFWHQKLFGNSFCIDNVGNLDRITQSIEGEYTTAANDRLRVTVQSHRPWPQAETLVANHKKGNLLIVVFKGQPYLIEELDTVKYVVKGQGTFGEETKTHLKWVVKRFRLRDADMGHIAFFESGKDKEADVQGSLYLKVARR